ncbi:MAG: phosphotransferase [Trueperaceae bacterium]|nr:phosphotransferase [Trueperaceae bacterium]
MAVAKSSSQPFSLVTSILDENALLELVATNYPHLGVKQSRLWLVGTTDTYVISTKAELYILRIYPTESRTKEDIAYELEVLLYLEQKGVAVSVPIQREDGHYWSSLNAPEGLRPYALFSYAPGREAYRETDYSERFGKSLAHLHSASDNFNALYERFAIDRFILLERPMQRLEPLLKDKLAYWDQFAIHAERLSQALESQRQDLTWGFCHGDSLGSNAHLMGETLTHFDFNDCGPGWRAYDLASYQWIKRWQAPKIWEDDWQQFLRGYQKVRPILSHDLKAVSLFVGLREFWTIGQQLYTARRQGHCRLTDDYFAKRLAFLATL